MTDLPVLAQRLKRARRTMAPHQRNIATNLIEQIGTLKDYVQPDWVTHPIYTLPVMIATQVEIFERAMNPETAA